MRKFSTALVIGASGGIGAAIADAAVAQGAATTRLSRRDDGFDLTDEASVVAAATRLKDAGAAFDLIFDATGALEANGAAPEKSFRQLDPAAMAASFAVNAIGPALIVKHFAPLLSKDGEAGAVFASLSARVGSIGDNKLGGWISYRASKAALNQILRCASVEIKRSHPNAVVIALHPGTIETDMTKKYARGRYTASPAEAAEQMLTVLTRLNAAETGGFLDYAGDEIIW